MAKSFSQYMQECGAADPGQATQQRTVNQIAEDKTAGRLSAIMWAAKNAIATESDVYSLAEELAASIFGFGSQQVAAVQTAIDNARRTPGHEVTLSRIQAYKRQLSRQQQKLSEELKETEAAIEDLKEIETELQAQPCVDHAILDILTLRQDLDGVDVLERLKGLYTAYKTNRAAMGLLFGVVAELTAKEYSANRLDLIQQVDFQELRRQIMAAIEG